MTMRDLRRKGLNGFMLGLCAVFAFITVSTLFVILGFLVYNGATSVNLDFFTKLPHPPGQNGGGMANAILGSAQIVVVATLIGLPVGFFAGIYLAEFGVGVYRALRRRPVKRYPFDRHRDRCLDGNCGSPAPLLGSRRQHCVEPDAD